MATVYKKYKAGEMLSLWMKRAFWIRIAQEDEDKMCYKSKLTSSEGEKDQTMSRSKVEETKLGEATNIDNATSAQLVSNTDVLPRRKRKFIRRKKFRTESLTKLKSIGREALKVDLGLNSNYDETLAKTPKLYIEGKELADEVKSAFMPKKKSSTNNVFSVDSKFKKKYIPRKLQKKPKKKLKKKTKKRYGQYDEEEEEKEEKKKVEFFGVYAHHKDLFNSDIFKDLGKH